MGVNVNVDVNVVVVVVVVDTIVDVNVLPKSRSTIVAASVWFRATESRVASTSLLCSDSNDLTSIVAPSHSSLSAVRWQLDPLAGTVSWLISCVGRRSPFR